MYTYESIHMNLYIYIYRYIPCGEFPDIVTLLSIQRSPITTDRGVLHRKETIMKNISSEYHKQMYYFLSNKD